MNPPAQIANKQQPPIIVTRLGANDVVIGRGFPATAGNEGNIRFRDLVRSLLPLYLATSQRSVKDRVARQVVRFVRGRSGRFVRRVESPEEADSIPFGTPSGVWIVVNDDSMLVSKIKQLFRDQHSDVQKNGGRKRKKRIVWKNQEATVPPSSPPTTTESLAPQQNAVLPHFSMSTLHLARPYPWTILPTQFSSGLSSLLRHPMSLLLGLEAVPVQNHTARAQASQAPTLVGRRLEPKSSLSEGLSLLAQAAVHRQAQINSSVVTTQGVKNGVSQKCPIARAYPSQCRNEFMHPE